MTDISLQKHAVGHLLFPEGIQIYTFNINILRVEPLTRKKNNNIALEAYEKKRDRSLFLFFFPDPLFVEIGQTYSWGCR